MLANHAGTRHRGPGHRVALLAAIFVLAFIAPVASQAATAKCVAIGDVHGDFDDFVALLQKIGLIDQDRHWKGAAVTLVQLGDEIDRGPKPRDVMDLLIALQPEARKAGGEVIPLLGNHEIMNIMGDLRYVTPANYASFADEKSEERRQAAAREFMKWRDKHKELVNELPPSFAQTEEQWLSQHPAGFIEQREAYAPNGKYGKWLRTHRTVAKVEGVVFLHGGLDPSVAAMGIDKINARIHDELNVFDNTRKYLESQQLILPFFTLEEIGAVVRTQVRIEERKGVDPSKQLSTELGPFMSLEGWLSMSSHGPVWFRAYDQWTDAEGPAQIATVLQAVNANAVVVGHTPQKVGHIRSRFDNRVFLIDTGMLSSYYPGGKASALEFESDGEIAAEYLDSRVVLVPAAAASPKAANPATTATAPASN